jgi:hypothetical protein
MAPEKKKGRFRALSHGKDSYCRGGVVVLGVQFAAAAWVPEGVVDEVTVGVVPDELPVPVLPLMVPLLLEVVPAAPVLEVPVVEAPDVPVEVEAPLMLPVLLVPAPVPAFAMVVLPAGQGLLAAEPVPVLEVAPAGVPVVRDVELGVAEVELCEPAAPVPDELEFCEAEPVPVVLVAPAGVPGVVADVAPAGVPWVVPVVADPLTPGVLVFCVPELLVALVGEEVVEVEDGEVD